MSRASNDTPRPRATSLNVAAATGDLAASAIVTDEQQPEARIAPERPAKPPRPPRDNSLLMRQWAARRQADLLLYLGAFMLSISAMIFVNYQGTALSGLGKSTILAVYTVLFLGGGVLIRRWVRVREAGPIFVALGAVLTPLNFVLLYTQVLSDQEVSRAAVTCAGSTLTAGLYLWLVRQGYGRFYIAPAIAATFVAWGSLGAAIHLRGEWYGAWFMAVAAGLNVAGELTKDARLRKWLPIGAFAVGAPSLLFAVVAAGSEDRDRGQLPMTLLLATAATFLTAYRSRRGWALGIVPRCVASLAGSTAWAFNIPHIGQEAYFGVWVVMAGFGYLAVAEFEQPRAMEWGTYSLLAGFAAVAYSQGLAIRGEFVGETYALPATYGLVLAGSVAGWWRWRWTTAIGTVPPLVAAVVASSLWAESAWQVEWLTVAAVSAASGYLLLEFFAPGEKERWYRSSLALGVASVALAHLFAVAADTNPWPLATCYAIFLAGVLWVGAARRDPRGWLLAAAAYTGAALSTAWALDLPSQDLAWLPLSGAYLLVATWRWWRSRPLMTGVFWPQMLILALAPLLFIDFYRDTPWTGAAAFAIAAGPWLFAALFNSGLLRLVLGAEAHDEVTHFERQMYACVSGFFALAAVGYANLALELSLEHSAWVFVAITAASWVSAAVISRRWPKMDGILLAVGLASLAVAFGASADAPGEQTFILGIASLAAAFAIRSRDRHAWRATMMLVGTASILRGHAAAIEFGTSTWELPAVYGLLIAGLAWDAFAIRFVYSQLALPAAVSAGLAALLWSLGVPPEHWAWPAVGIALIIALAEPVWRGWPVLAKAGWQYALLLAFAPLLLLDVYVDAPMAGAGSLMLAAGTWMLASLRSNGALLGTSEKAIFVERQLLAAGAVALLFGALGYFVRGIGLAIDDASWVFAGAGTASWLGSRIIAPRQPGSQGLFAIAGGPAFAIAVLLALDEPSQVAIILGMASLAATIAVQPPAENSWRIIAGALGLAALTVGHAEAAAGVGVNAWALPVADALVLVAAAWDSRVNRCEWSWLLVPALLALSGSSALWAAGAGPEHLAWPALATGALLAVTSRWWLVRAKLNRLGWPYVLALALVPIGAASTAPYDGPDIYGAAPVAGALAFALAAALWALTAVLGKGLLPAWIKKVEPRFDRTVPGMGAVVLAFISAGYTSQAFELQQQEAGWVFLGIAVAAWIALAIVGERLRGVTAIGIATGIGATMVAVSAADGFAGQQAVLLAVSAAGSALSIAGVRRWPMLFLPSVGAGLSLAFAWEWSADLAVWSLALVYAGLAVVTALATTRWRDWRSNERSVTVAWLYLGWIAAATVAAWTAIVLRSFDFDAETAREWLTLGVVILVTGCVTSFDGVRLKRPGLAIFGTVMMLLALEIGIAHFEPFTAQAYLAPLGVYLLVLSLFIRESKPLIGPHMYGHEGLSVAGIAFIVLPAANDALASGEIRWSLLLIAEALLFLATGFIIGQRWLVVCGVLTLVGVAGRFFSSGGNQPPYWLTLGLVGTALIGLGVLLLGARDWWDRRKEQAARWWMGKQYGARHEVPL